MARVKFGFGISDVRGKVGGAVFAGSRAGTILKNKAVMTHRESGAVTLIRSHMTQSQFWWDSLTSQTQQLWNAYAKLVPVGQRNNPNLFLSGRQLYIKFQQYRLLYGLGFYAEPDLSVVSMEPIAFQLGLYGNDLTFSFDRVLVPADEFVCFATTGPVRKGLLSPGNRFKYLIFSTPAANEIDIATQYVEKFGLLPQIGTYIFWKAFLYSRFSPVRTTPFITKQEFL